MEGQQFCLRWHNFQNTLLTSLPKLLDGGHLTDVTLSAGGGHIRAHRIILSACSHYFKELFKELSSLQHPVIVLPGMDYANLCALVTFMYNGEVNIYQDQLPALLAMADALHIRGLADIAGKNAAQDNGRFTDSIASSNDTMSEEPSNASFHIKVEKDNVKGCNNNVEIVEPLEALESSSNAIAPPAHYLDKDLTNGRDNNCDAYSVKTKPYYSINAKLNQRERKIGSNNSISGGQSSSNNYVDSEFREGGGGGGTQEDSTSATSPDERNPPLDVKPSIVFDGNSKYLGSNSTMPQNRPLQNCNKTTVTCLICGKQLSNQYNLRVHMETHSNSSYSCTACSHVSRSRDALRKHVSYRHPVATAQKRPRYSLSKP